MCQQKNKSMQIIFIKCLTNFQKIRIKVSKWKKNAQFKPTLPRCKTFAVDKEQEAKTISNKSKTTQNRETGTNRIKWPIRKEVT